MANCRWKNTQRNSGSGVSTGVKRGPGAIMSHHEACETSARNQHGNLPTSRSYFYERSSRSGSKNLRSLLSALALLVTWTSLMGAVLAHERPRDQQGSATLDPEWKGPSLLILDTRYPPVAPLMQLHRRQDEENPSKTTSAPTSRSSVATDPEITLSDFDIPRPFDTALSNNFTEACATFFYSLLGDQAFQQCHPFSLMLQTSSALFDASKSFLQITQTLEATCSVDLPTCLGTMSQRARDLVADNNCAEDYANDNPQVIQAYNGLVAYEPVYQASCLRDDGGSYCYANAVTNRSATTDSYPYYLPLGVPLPGGTRATCNSCLQNAMAIFSVFAGNSSQPVSKTYNGAAQQVGIACGAGFVNQTAIPLKGAAPAISASFTPIITLIFMFMLYFVQ